MDSTPQLLERLEALTARLDRQEQEVVMLRSRLAESSGESSPPEGHADSGSGVSRRDLLLKGAVGVAVAAIAAAHPEVAHADTRTTVLGGSVAPYGAAVTAQGFDPATQLPTIGALTFGLIGTTSTASPSPNTSSAILALGNSFRGLQGLSTSAIGVYGQSTSNYGVVGSIPETSSAAGTIATYGVNLSTNTGGSPGNGGFGCYGYSLKGHGLVGATGTAGGGAVVGSTNGVAGAYAGIFFGQLVVVGGAKNAAVPHPDGTHRLLYCMESPESWFEDFGNARLAGGRAEVTIDPEFAIVADLSDYHVFVTPYGDTQGLYVIGRTPTGFTVQEHDCGAGEVPFAWRVVARRKDISAERLAKVVLSEPAVPPDPARTPARVPPANDKGPERRGR